MSCLIEWVDEKPYGYPEVSATKYSEMGKRILAEITKWLRGGVYQRYEENEVVMFFKKRKR